MYFLFFCKNEDKGIIFVLFAFLTALSLSIIFSQLLMYWTKVFPYLLYIRNAWHLLWLTRVLFAKLVGRSDIVSWCHDFRSLSFLGRKCHQSVGSVLCNSAVCGATSDSWGPWRDYGPSDAWQMLQVLFGTWTVRQSCWIVGCWQTGNAAQPSIFGVSVFYRVAWYVILKRFLIECR